VVNALAKLLFLIVGVVIGGAIGFFMGRPVGVAVGWFVGFQGWASLHGVQSASWSIIAFVTLVGTFVGGYYGVLYAAWLTSRSRPPS
jgi:hypothetical protein